MSEEGKSLDRWRYEIKVYGKPHWLRFYQDLMGQAASSNMRFFRALKLYGDWPMFEAIVASSDKDLTGDKLNYVVTVAKNIWKEQQQERDAETDYLDVIESAKEASHKQNEALARKLKKAQVIANKRPRGRPPKNRGDSV